jgi:hypothetical protein
MIVTCSPVPVPEMPLPGAVAATTPPSDMAVEGDSVAGDKFATTWATTPLANMFSFNPYRTQVTVPVPLAQEIAFAAVKAVPAAVTDSPETSVGE